MNLLQNVPLKKYSNLKIGGNASYFYEFSSKEDLINALNLWEKIENKNKGILILGDGTNILFSDAGFRGLVLRNRIDFIRREENIIEVGAGTSFGKLIDFCTQNSLSGFEWAGGLPGTVGGAIRGNAGAFLGGTSQNILEVTSINIWNLKTIVRDKKECNFGYRQSVYKSGEGKKEIILLARFKLEKGDREEIKRKTQERIDYRIDRHPLDLPNLGSTFKNVPAENVPEKVLMEFEGKIKQDPFPVLPAVKLLVGAGLKGKVIGGAMFSTKHPNFIVNYNHAKAKDVLALIGLAKKLVKEKYNVSLEEEIMIL